MNDATASPTQPLAGLRVLDAAEEKGEFCGRLLADLGAEVLRLEPPGGAASRSMQPLAATPAGGTASLYFALRNAGKRGITLDLGAEAGRALLHRLLERMDIFIETSKPGWLEAHQLAPGDLIERHSELVMTSITDHGRTGPYRDFEGTSLTGFAMSGLMHKSGAAHQPPCNAPGHLAYDAAAVCAAFPTLMAYYQRRHTGRGQHVDCSVQESLVAMADWSIPNASIHAGIQARNGPGMYPLYDCADGHVRMVVLVTAHWRELLDWMGNPSELADPKFDQYLQRLIHISTIDPFINRFFSSQKKLDVCREGQRRGIPVMPLLRPGEVLDNDHTRARKSFRTLELEPGFPVTLPSGFVQLDGTRAGPRTGPPAPGQDNEAIYCGELGLSGDELAALRAQGAV